MARGNRDHSPEKARRALFIVLLGSIITLMLLFVAYGAFSLKYFYVNVNGESMIPVFQDGDRVIFEKIDEPSRGDFVVFNLPQAWEEEWRGRDDANLIKRIALIPGDELAWDGENWYANGEQFSYLKSGDCQVDPVEVTLKDNQFFVTGDTTSGKTMDSREAFCKGLDYLVSESDVVNYGQVKKIF